MNRVLRMAASLAVVFTLCGFQGECSQSGGSKLPPMPEQLKTCLRQAGVDIPDRDLTVAEVERLWKTDRVRIVALRQCGNRIVAWYARLQREWK